MAAGERRVGVKLGARSYDVVIAPSFAGLRAALSLVSSSTKLAVVTDDAVAPYWLDALRAELGDLTLIVIAFLVIRNNTKLWIEDSAIQLLATIVTWCLGLALFLTMSEIVVELYARTEHANGLYYLMFGLHGLTSLVPWFWSSLAFMLIAFVMFLIPSVRSNYKLLPIACVLAFAGIWIEKGMGLVVPGFVPTPLGEIVEYLPTWNETAISLGIWAFGLLCYTFFLRMAVPILQGTLNRSNESPSSAAS